jgi:hypothetical protein
MRCIHSLALAALLGASLAAQAGDAAPKAATTPAAKATPAASAAATGGAGNTAGAPKTGGAHSGAGDSKSTSGQQISPKKPKCPDPTVTCPAEKAIGK